QALAHTAAVHGAHPQLLRSVMDINRDQRLRVVQKLTEVLGGLEGRRIGILGAAFKPHTDDLRYSPAIELAALLCIEGAQVAVYDPVVSADAIERSGCGAKASANVESAAIGAQALVLATEWPEFRDLPFARLAQLMAYPVLVDARNFLDGAVLRGAGFVYRSIGRPASDGGPLPAERDVWPSELAATVAAR
ncbi:MAG TPA: UDP binding domain-containing protein, partial [Dehalococcoidia bacterium]|nr:UDP binding domain-containing protein [Dehalococcoidia bacterium]